MLHEENNTSCCPLSSDTKNTSLSFNISKVIKLIVFNFQVMSTYDLVKRDIKEIKFSEFPLFYSYIFQDLSRMKFRFSRTLFSLFFGFIVPYARFATTNGHCSMQLGVWRALKPPTGSRVGTWWGFGGEVPGGSADLSFYGTFKWPKNKCSFTLVNSSSGMKSIQ